MDLKGLAWVGDIYQKFESMCLEIQESLCEDTTKYVENQVQVVSASMKKFYSDATQDFLPPSPPNSSKVAAGHLSVYNGIRKNKQPTKVVSESNRDLEVFHSPDENVISSCELPLAKNLPVSSNAKTVSRACSEQTPLVQCKSKKVQKGTIVNRKGQKKLIVNRKAGSREDDPSLFKRSRSNTDVATDCGNASSCLGTRVDQEQNLGKMVGLIPSDSVRGPEPESIQEGSIDSQISDVDVPLPEASTSSSWLNMLPSIQSDLRNSSSSGGSFLEFGDAIDENAINNVIEAAEGATLKKIHLFENTKLEETCVLVDSDKQLSCSQEEIKNNPCKKIQEPFSSRKMTASKQEYRRLAAEHRGAKMSRDLHHITSPHTVTISLNSSQTKDSYDSEWEFL